jgi:hypothetical protein
MAALEYLNQNSLTCHPFKGRVVVVGNSNPIRDNWFYDILFVSFLPEIRSVYISQIIKDETSSLRFTFSNADTLTQVAVVLIPAQYAVSHYKNADISCAPYSNSQCAVKIVLGEGLVAETTAAFNQIYQPEETTLSNAASFFLVPG